MLGNGTGNASTNLTLDYTVCCVCRHVVVAFGGILLCREKENNLHKEQKMTTHHRVFSNRSHRAANDFPSVRRASALSKCHVPRASASVSSLGRLLFEFSSLEDLDSL